MCFSSLWLRSASCSAAQYFAVCCSLLSRLYVLAGRLAAKWPSYEVDWTKLTQRASLPSCSTGRLLRDPLRL